MPIHGQTTNGAKNLVLRGWLGPRGRKGFTQGSITTAAGDKQFWDGTAPSFTVTVDRGIVQGAQATSVTSPVVTASVTATASGGSAPYAYAWTLVSDDGLGGTWTAQYPSSAGTTFKASAVPATGSSTATFRCTVTDARGAVQTIDVTAIAQNYGPLS